MFRWHERLFCVYVSSIELQYYSHNFPEGALATHIPIVAPPSSPPSAGALT